MSELIEGEVCFHVPSKDAKANPSEARATDHLINVLRTYLKLNRNPLGLVNRWPRMWPRGMIQQRRLLYEVESVEHG
jgi:hypothetical protein